MTPNSNNKKVRKPVLVFLEKAKAQHVVNAVLQFSIK